MRLVFMGTPAFAVPSLLAADAAHDVVAAYTRPDRPRGRGRVPVPSPVAAAAAELGLAVERPASLREDGVVERLHAEAPDVICVVAYGQMLPPEVLEIPRHGCVNVHASLLPRWRGAAPIERAILAGDAETGVSIMAMEERLDTGPVARRVRVPIEGRSADDLRDVLSREGAAALLETLEDIAGGSVSWEPQREEGVTYAEKVLAADVVLAPDLAAAVLERRVRASSRSAPSRAALAGRLVTVLEAHEVEGGPGAGSVGVLDGAPVLGCSEGGLVLDRVTPAGRGAMSGADFARGARLAADATWVAPA